MLQNINTMKLLYAFFILIMLSSCDAHFEERSLYGCYTPANYRNSIDTLYLQPQGLYHRKVYDKNHKLVLDMNGKWSLEKKHIIKLSPYYLNLDDDLIRFPDNVYDTTGEVTTFFEAQNGVVQFCVGYHEGENCYQKTK
jgi:hypothetical protein